MNLIHHPSYQELADNNKRRSRTRRSRIGINGGNGKDEPRFVPNSLNFVNDPDLDLEPESELVAPPEIPSPNLGKSGWNSEKMERTKVKIDPVKPVVETPEIVSVEMSGDEQDVFALMGISPVVKLDREIKSPKSLVINIVQPGQPTQPFPQTAPTFYPPIIPEPIIMEQPIVEPIPVNMPTPKIDREEPSFTQLSIDEEFVNFADDNEINSISIPNRRRRRRSSALDSEDS
jgi:ribonuclease E